ncbi:MULTISPECIES: hypothetical protein [Delftia]|uniref:hypothetical protein n=1 Tax=Delftia TaxID=80865 RepID=UPI0006408FA0|nr:hypothetical protein [Delftia lacustris]
MDLNQKIAERRAQLQKEEAAQEALKRQEALEQRQREQARERAIKESAEKEAARKIQEIEAQLHSTKEKVSTDAAPVLDERVSQEAKKKVDAHISALANKRFTKGENWVFGLLMLGTVLGFFMAWWFGMGMLIWTCYYVTKVSNRHEAEIRAELAQSEEGSNE